LAARECGDVSPLPPWRQQMYELTGENKREFPDKYRDVWRDAHVLEEAHAHAARLKQNKPGLVNATAG